MTHPDDNQAVYWSLLQVVFAAKRTIHGIAERHGLTAMQASTLAMLQENEPLAMNALSSQFNCDASNVTGLADRLESRGLIQRQDHPTDRRIKLIALTPEGARLRQTIMDATVEAEAARLNPVLSPRERIILYELLQKILAAGKPSAEL